ITKAIDGAAAISFPALDTRNVALYFPLVKQIDLLRNGKEELFVPCGIIAGIMARIDSTVGVWKAPAGSNAVMMGISGFQVVLNDRDNGLLNNSGINCLRNLRAHGHVIWGARTFRVSLQVNDEFKYIPVRRTALFIEESIYRGIQWAVFESNDEPLWTRLRTSIESFMHNLYRQGAFPGSTPKEAYFIRCGNDTISQNDITQGKLNIIVGFAPLKPAEFVLIHFHLQVQFA
ncbi:MAG: phage tail sheath C-terminal domain-containing protein, partial [Chitinophagaceae bacterium]